MIRWFTSESVRASQALPRYPAKIIKKRSRSDPAVRVKTVGVLASRFYGFDFFCQEGDLMLNLPQSLIEYFHSQLILCGFGRDFGATLQRRRHRFQDIADRYRLTGRGLAY